MEVRFVPSRVEGLSAVGEVRIRPDRMELETSDGPTVIRFVDIAVWPAPRWLRRQLFRFGIRPGWLPVADRDWFHVPPDRFFTFYTTPRLTIHMPADEPPSRLQSTFLRVQEVLRAGGFATFDLG